MCGEYLLEKLKVGKSRGFSETEYFTSRDGGLFGTLVFFPVLHLVAIKKMTM